MPLLPVPVCYGTPTTQFTPLYSGLTVPGSTLALPLAGAVEGRIICSLASAHSFVVTYFATSAHSFEPTHKLRPDARLPTRRGLSRTSHDSCPTSTAFIANCSSVKMPKMPGASSSAKKHTLTLAQLSSYDDMLTDALVDRVRTNQFYPLWKALQHERSH